MLDGIWKVNSRSDWHGAGSRPGSKHSRRQPLLEVLEGRQLLTASLAPIANITVPALLGYQLPLDGSGTKDDQTFTPPTSSNPDIKVSVAQGQFWTLNVQHNASSSSDISFAGALTFQLFQDLTPNTVAQISKFTTDGWYNGKDFTRIANMFPGATDYVAQGGAANSDGTGTTPYPDFNDEFVQQDTFTGTQQLAMANLGANTNNTQFFVTTGTPTFLDFKHTVFGQLVSGSNILADMTKVSVKANPALKNEQSLPVSPIVITSASLSSTNPNGVLHIDTTSATKNETATITVTATDATDHTTATRSFTVTVGDYNGPTTSANLPINFIPSVSPVSATSSFNQTNIPVTLSGKSNYPDTTKPGTLTYNIVTQPAHGTITQFDSTAGTLVYVPDTNYVGPDSFTYNATSTGSATSAPASPPSLPATVTLNVTGAHAAATLIDGVLVVTPPPRTVKGTDNIRVTQQADSTGGQKIVVFLNGVPDTTQPAADSSLIQIIVFGGKASTDIQVDPNVLATIPITLDGGHGGHNVIQAGAGPTREHGWFGHTLLIGGTGSNELIGRKGFVRFKPTATTNMIYAGNIKPRFKHRTVPPSGTYYRYVNGRLVPVLTT